MVRHVRWSLVMLALLASISMVPNSVGAQEVLAGTVTVTGNGSVKVKPDMATFTIGADVTMDSVPEALEESNEKLTAIVAAVTALGIDAEDIQTANFSVYAVRDYNQPATETVPPVIGYTVSNQISVTVRDLKWDGALPSDRLGDVIGAAVEAGATDIYSVGFSVADPTLAEREARDLAVQNAGERAAQLAGSAGKSAGEVVVISEGVTYTPLGIPYGAGAAGDSSIAGGGTPIYGGSVDVTVSVTVTYSLV